jgi:CRISPR type III-A-associated RAMP protein Csm4
MKVEDYLIKLKINSGFNKKISGDQLTGGFLYFLNLKKDPRFKKFYQDFLNNNPPFMLSSLLPDGYLPLNSNFIIDKIFSQSLSKDETKKIKKIKYLKKELFENLTAYKDEIQKMAENSTKIERKDRLVKVSIKNDALFADEAINFVDKTGNIYLRIFNQSPDIKTEKENIVQFISYFVGKKVSSGMANFAVEKIESIKLPTEGDFFINLSPFVPKKEEEEIYQPLYFEYFIKYPKLGIATGGKNPFKKKIIQIGEGSVFEMKTKENKFFYGAVLKNVSVAFKDAIQVCLGYPFYFKL